MLMAAYPTAEILLSTYNGARFLPEFAESLRRQHMADVRLRLRDDGSQDGSVETARKLFPAAAIIDSGSNLGPAQSFFRLLAEADETADIVMFADQDDFWLPDRVARAGDMLAAAGPSDMPLLYCSRVSVTDERLRIVGAIPPEDTRPSFGNALIENIAMGCTIAMNQAARRLLLSRPLPGDALMHDWWCYLVVSAFGRVVFDPQPTILYRRHDGTFTHFEVSYARNILARIVRPGVLRRLLEIRSQTRSFCAAFGDLLPPRQRRLVDLVAGIGSASSLPALLSEKEITRNRAVDTMIFRAAAIVCVAIGK